MKKKHNPEAGCFPAAVGNPALPGNPYDGHTLSDALNQVENLTGTRPSDCCVDLGYCGNHEEKCEVHVTRNRAALKTYALRRDMRRRSAIEPIIGHDLRIILKKLKLFWLKIFLDLYKHFFAI